MVEGSGFKGSGFRVSELIMQGLRLMVQCLDHCSYNQ